LDSHTHLDIVVGERPAHGAGDEGWPPDDEVDAEIAAAAAVGIPRLVQVGVDVASSRWSAGLAARHPSVLAAVAIHPNEAGAGAADDDALAEIDRLAALPRVRAVGETGLDRFRTGPDGWAAQEAAFRAHIRIAKEHGIALVIHDRDAHDEILRVLEDEGAPRHTVFHCFSGDADFAKACVERGYVLSFAGTLTFTNAANLREAAAGRDRRTLPHPHPPPRPPQRQPPGATHRASSGGGQSHGPEGPLRSTDRDRSTSLRTLGAVADHRLMSHVAKPTIAGS
jgi:TatD DNase family protein